MLPALATVAACGGRAPQPAATAQQSVTSQPAATSQHAATSQPAAGVELPAGPGRELLLRDCLGCHDLGGLALYQGFYTRDDWLVLVQTMVAHGAATDAAEAETVADYLAQHFGREP